MVTELRNGTRSLVVRGTLAGLAATLPMSLVMVLLHRRLPWWERYPLPPRQVTMGTLRKVGLPRPSDEGAQTALTVVAHFAYGAAAGAPYALLARAVRLPVALMGIGYGLVVWAGSYLGWLPLARILPPATEHPRRRTAIMIAGHIVYGLALGLLASGKRGSDPSPEHQRPGELRQQTDLREPGATPRDLRELDRSRIPST